MNSSTNPPAPFGVGKKLKPAVIKKPLRHSSFLCPERPALTCGTHCPLSCQSTPNAGFQLSPPSPALSCCIMLVLLEDYVIRASMVMSAAVSRPAVLSLVFSLSATDRAVTDSSCYFELNSLVCRDSFPTLLLATLFSKNSRIPKGTEPISPFSAKPWQPGEALDSVSSILCFL